MTTNAVSSTHLGETSELAKHCQVQSYAIGSEMKKAGLPDDFIVAAVTIAAEYEEVFQLLKMWARKPDQSYRDAIVADIQELIDDCSQPGKIDASASMPRSTTLHKIARALGLNQVQIVTEWSV